MEDNPPGAHRLWSDSEISTPVEDLLARGRFCAQVAALINGIALGEGSTVFGLVGPWGGGKSSILNLVKSELEQNGDGLAIAEFSPWAAGDGASLMLEFFGTLLGAHESLRSASNRESMTVLIKKGLPMLGSIPLVGNAVSKTMEGVLGDRNWVQEFERIDNLVAEAKVRILIVVDDVDRLHGDEILTLIKTIRLLGRFRNVHYLLAYDHDALIDAIRPSLGGDRDRASAYLEKIVQYPLTIPPAQQAHLRLMVENGLARLLEADPKAWSRFSPVYDELLQDRLQTVRAVKRFCAQADLYFSLVLHEVDVTDFLIVSYLRLFFPSVYSRISLWKEKLTSEEESDSTILTWENNLLSAGVAGADDRIHIIKVLRTIFPNEFGTPAPLAEAGVARRDYFDRYFVFGIPEGDVSDQQVRADVALVVRQGSGPYDERDFRHTFTSPSPNVRSTALSKAASVVKLDPSHIASVTAFILWLAADRAAVVTRHSNIDAWMEAIISKDFDYKGWAPFQTHFRGWYITSGLDHFSRIVGAHRLQLNGQQSVSTMKEGTHEEAGPSWETLLETVAAVSLERLIELSQGGPQTRPDEYDDLVNFLREPRFVEVLRPQFHSWSRQRESKILSLGACFVREPDARFGMGERGSNALELDVYDLLAVVDEEVLGHIPLDVGELEKPSSLWDKKLRTAAEAISRWRARTSG